MPDEIIGAVAEVVATVAVGAVDLIAEVIGVAITEDVEVPKKDKKKDEK